MKFCSATVVCFVCQVQKTVLDADEMFEVQIIL